MCPERSLFERLGGEARLSFRTQRVFSDQCRLRGSWYYRNRRFKHALHAFEASAAVDPDNPKALLNLAVLWQGQGRLEDSLALLLRAVALDPAYRKAWQNLAKLYDRMGKAALAEEARRELRAFDH